MLKRTGGSPTRWETNNSTQGETKAPQEVSPNVFKGIFRVFFEVWVSSGLKRSRHQDRIKSEIDLLGRMLLNDAAEKGQEQEGGYSGHADAGHLCKERGKEGAGVGRASGCRLCWDSVGQTNGQPQCNDCHWRRPRQRNVQAPGPPPPSVPDGASRESRTYSNTAVDPEDSAAGGAGRLHSHSGSPNHRHAGTRKGHPDAFYLPSTFSWTAVYPHHQSTQR